MMLGDRHPIEAELIREPELLEGDRHRFLSRCRIAIFRGQRPDTLRRVADIARGAKERGFHGHERTMRPKTAHLCSLLPARSAGERLAEWRRSSHNRTIINDG